MITTETGTIALLALKIIYDLIKDKKRAEVADCVGSDCYYPSDRIRDQKTHSNTVKIAHTLKVDPEV